MDPNCIFCKIVQGEIPSFKVWEDENFLAFLTIQPVKEGHTLVIPKKHIDYFYDLENDDLGQLMIATKPVAKKLKNAFKPKTERIGVMIAGMGVPHVHIHLIPLDEESDLSFANQHQVPSEELQKMLKIIQNS